MPKVRITGAAKIQEALDSIPARVDAAVQAAMKREADKLVAQALDDMAHQSVAYRIATIRERMLI